MVLHLLQPKISSKERLLSVILLERILQIQQEKFLTLNTKSNQKLHWRCATTLTADITISTKTFEVADGSTLTKGTYIDIDGERCSSNQLPVIKLLLIVSNTMNSWIMMEYWNLIDDADDVLVLNMFFLVFEVSVPVR